LDAIEISNDLYEQSPCRPNLTAGSNAIILGLIAGYIGSKIVNKRGEGLIRDIILGIVGAIVGGWLFRTVGASGVTGLNIYSLVVAVIGAIVVLLIYHAVRRANLRGRSAKLA
jgi:uncharacterized membrane protein YeaQ/YmgE (transglycosylase-associated protein family)